MELWVYYYGDVFITRIIHKNDDNRLIGRKSANKVCLFFSLQIFWIKRINWQRQQIKIMIVLSLIIILLQRWWIVWIVRTIGREKLGKIIIFQCRSQLTLFEWWFVCSGGFGDVWRWGIIDW